MNKTHITFIFAFLSVSTCSGMSFERHDAELQLVAADSVCMVDQVTGKSGELPLKVFVHNNSRHDIQLVVPEEGSHQGKGWPFIGWSVLEGDSGQHPLVLPLDKSPRLGSIEPAIYPTPVYIAGKGSLELHDWLDIPSGLMPGTYRIVFYYQNDASIEPASTIKPNNTNLYRYEYRCSLRSNEVRIRVVSRP